MTLVFSLWTALLDRVEPRLHHAELAFVRLDGSTGDRAGVVARFRDPAGPPVSLISLEAGVAGLNLPAVARVFLLDPGWSPSAEDQAADRAHHIGQDKPVMAFRLVAQATGEERILVLQARVRAAGAAGEISAGSFRLTTRSGSESS